MHDNYHHFCACICVAMRILPVGSSRQVARACLCVCVRACVRVCVCVCVRVHVKHPHHVSYMHTFDELPGAREDKQNSFPVNVFGPHLYSHFLPLVGSTMLPLCRAAAAAADRCAVVRTLNVFQLLSQSATPPWQLELCVCLQRIHKESARI